MWVHDEYRVYFLVTASQRGHTRTWNDSEKGKNDSGYGMASIQGDTGRAQILWWGLRKQGPGLQVPGYSPTPLRVDRPRHGSRSKDFLNSSNRVRIPSQSPSLPIHLQEHVFFPPICPFSCLPLLPGQRVVGRGFQSAPATLQPGSAVAVAALESLPQQPSQLSQLISQQGGAQEQLQFRSAGDVSR